MLRIQLLDCPKRLIVQEQSSLRVLIWIRRPLAQGCLANLLQVLLPISSQQLPLIQVFYVVGVHQISHRGNVGEIVFFYCWRHHVHRIVEGTVR